VDVTFQAAQGRNTGLSTAAQQADAGFLDFGMASQA